MNNWRFVVVRHFGGAWHRRTTCTRIKQAVERRGASDALPLVKFELGRGGEYYLGLAVNMPGASDQVVPELAQEVLRSADVPTNRALWPIDADRVLSLLRGSLESESFTVPIEFEPDAHREPVDWDRVVQECDAEDDDRQEDEEPPKRFFEHLLYWCSAVGEGDGTRFRDACRELGGSEPWNTTWSVLRRFALLGHVEYEINSGLRWAVNEPALVQRAGKPGECYLAGQRTPQFLDALTQGEGTRVTQPGGPCRIGIRIAGPEATPGWNGHPIGWAGCAAENIASKLPAIADWARQLPVWDEKDFGRYQTERYVPDQDRFLPHAPVSKSAEGLYRFRLDVGSRQVNVLSYYDSAEERWHCGDFYGLRFLARARSRGAHALWRAASGDLLVPAADRWPMPYERALVLASGLLPGRVSTAPDGTFLRYSELTQQLAEHLCSLLGIQVKVSDE